MIPRELDLKKRKLLCVSIILIIALGFAVYGNSLNGKFIWDDNSLVRDNFYIRSWSGIGKFFAGDISTEYEARNFKFYRPLQLLTYTIDYSLYKLNVIGYHLTNILLHILVALSIYWLVNILYNDKLISLLTSLFFVVHPVHTGPAAYISGRSDSLGALFMLLTVIFYIKALHVDKIHLYLLMILTYSTALLSRETSLILPIILLLYHCTFKKKVKLKRYLSILTITIVYILLRIILSGDLLTHPISSSTLLQRLPGFFVAITNYIRLLIWPFNLFHMEYGSRLFNLTNPKVILGIFIVFSSIIYAFRNRSNNRLIFFSIAWFFITLLPVSNLYPINAYMADNWLYVPSIGAFLILANILSCLYRKKRTLSIILIISLSSFYSYLTIKQNEYWTNPIAFYKRILKYVPDSWKAYAHLGIVYRENNRNKEAISSYQKALEINPNNARTYYNLGNLYSLINKNDEAIASYQKALEVNPDYAGAYNNLAIVYANFGKNEEAISLFKKAIEISPKSARTYYNLANAYSEIGKREEEIILYKKAIEINPDYVNAYDNLGIAYYEIGKNEEAISSYKKAIEVDTNYAKAYYDLSVVYFHVKQYDLAIKYCEEALELGFEVPPEFLEKLKLYR